MGDNVLLGYEGKRMYNRMKKHLSMSLVLFVVSDFYDLLVVV